MGGFHRQQPQVAAQHPFRGDVSLSSPCAARQGFDLHGYRTVTRESDTRNHQNGTPGRGRIATAGSPPRRGSAVLGVQEVAQVHR
jgi:hypothetical protein